MVHAEHGIGRYEGLIIINSAGGDHDCLHLVYSGGDKLYLPVENIELLSRYGNAGGEAQLDKLVVLHGRRVLPASKAAFGLWPNSLSRLRRRVIVRAPNL